MNKVVNCIALSVALASGLGWAGAAVAGEKTVVNNTDHGIKIVALTRCPEDDNAVTCMAGKVKLSVGKGKQKTLTYPTTFLNAVIVSGPENCAVTVNERGDAGDATMNVNSILTVDDLNDADPDLKGICTISGSNP